MPKPPDSAAERFPRGKSMQSSSERSAAPAGLWLPVWALIFEAASALRERREAASQEEPHEE